MKELQVDQLIVFDHARHRQKQICFVVNPRGKTGLADPVCAVAEGLLNFGQNKQHLEEYEASVGPMRYLEMTTIFDQLNDFFTRIRGQQTVKSDYTRFVSAKNGPSQNQSIAIIKKLWQIQMPLFGTVSPKYFGQQKDNGKKLQYEYHGGEIVYNQIQQNKNIKEQSFMSIKQMDDMKRIIKAQKDRIIIKEESIRNTTS